MTQNGTQGVQAGAGGVGLIDPVERESLAAMPNRDLLMRYRVGIELFDPRTMELDDQMLDHAFLEDVGVGRMPIRVLLGHVADVDVASVHRMRRIIGEDGPVLSAWDHEAFIDNGIYGTTEGEGPKPGFPVGAYAAVIYTMRQWASGWLAGLDDAAWERSAMHPQHGKITLRTIVEYDTWHLEHHSRYLNAKIERLLGPVPDDWKPGGCCGGGTCGGEGCTGEAAGESSGGEAKGSGGCGPGCGCG
ncbi:MAG: DinB family protein [Planctomycetota bacterium]